MSPSFRIPNSSSNIFIKMPQHTIAHQFIKSFRISLIYSYSYLRTRVKTVNQHHTMAHPHTPSPVAVEIRSVWLPVGWICSNCADILSNIHGYMWMPSTLRVRDRSGRYIVFPTWHKMHRNKLQCAWIGFRQNPHTSKHQSAGMGMCGGGGVDAHLFGALMTFWIHLQAICPGLEWVVPTGTAIKFCKRAVGCMCWRVNVLLVMLPENMQNTNGIG